MRNSGVVALVLLCTACTSYVAPGGPARLGEINRVEGADPSARQPSPHFPANVAVVRVQAPRYRSPTSKSYGEGKFSVMTTRELLSQAQLDTMGRWPSIGGVTTIDAALLPSRLESMDDLRLAAAKAQADILLVFTVDTTFQVGGQRYGAATKVPLGEAGEVASSASAVFTDVRTGFTYGNAQAQAAAVLDAAAKSGEAADGKRLDAERQAFTALLADAQDTWAGIAKRYR